MRRNRSRIGQWCTCIRHSRQRAGALDEIIDGVRYYYESWTMPGFVKKRYSSRSGERFKIRERRTTNLLPRLFPLPHETSTKRGPHNSFDGWCGLRVCCSPSQRPRHAQQLAARHQLCGQCAARTASSSYILLNCRRGSLAIARCEEMSDGMHDPESPSASSPSGVRVERSSRLGRGRVRVSTKMTPSREDPTEKRLELFNARHGEAAKALQAQTTALAARVGMLGRATVRSYALYSILHCISRIGIRHA